MLLQRVSIQHSHTCPPSTHRASHTHRPTDICTETHGSLLFSGRSVLEPVVVSDDTVTPGGFSTLTFSAIRFQHNVTLQRQSMRRPTGRLSPALLFIFCNIRLSEPRTITYSRIESAVVQLEMHSGETADFALKRKVTKLQKCWRLTS